MTKKGFYGFGFPISRFQFPSFMVSNFSLLIFLVRLSIQLIGFPIE